MANITIITDHKYRDLIWGYELSEKERKEFDYFTDEEIVHHAFFRYKGQVYSLGDFMRIDRPEVLPPNSYLNSFQTWHGYASDSAFSGVLVQYDKDCERVKVGRYSS